MNSARSLCLYAFALLFVAGSWTSCLAQTPAFAWAHAIGGAFNDDAMFTTTDAVGNLILAGTYADAVDFDPGPGTAVLSTGGMASRAFVCKWDTAGNFMWVRQFEGNVSGPGEVVVDAAGNIILVGGFMDTIDLDPGPAAYIETSLGFNAVFLVKLDPQGNFLWGYSGGSAQVNGSVHATVDAGGNIYTTGYHTGPMDLNFGVGTQAAIPDGWDGYITKYSPSGQFLWGRSLSGPGTQDVVQVLVGASGDVYYAGMFQDSADFDGGPGVHMAFAQSLSGDLYVTKLDANGNFKWVRTFRGTGQNYTEGLLQDPAHAIWLLTTFEDTMDYDPGPGVNAFVALGYRDMGIVKLDTAGDFLWAGHCGGTAAESPKEFTVDAQGNIYIIGAMGPDMDADPGAGVFNLQGPQNINNFLQKLDQNGSFVWATLTGGNSDDFGDVSLGTNGHLYTTGSFINTVDLNPGQDTAWFTSAGYGDAYIQKWMIATPVAADPSHPAEDPFSMYPNPATETFTVHAPSTATLRILDSWGTQVVGATLKPGTTVHQLPQLPAGIYQAQFLRPGNTTTLKLQIVR